MANLIEINAVIQPLRYKKQTDRYIVNSEFVIILCMDFFKI